MFRLYRSINAKRVGALVSSVFHTCGKHRCALLCAVAAPSGFGLGIAAQAQSLVVRSTGPSATQFPIGRVLASNASVTLGDRDRLMVLDKSGSRILMGPGSFTLDGKVTHDQDALIRMRKLLDYDGPHRIRMSGGVRGGAAATGNNFEKVPRSIWSVDVSKGGTYCAVKGAPLTLWRRNTDHQESWKVTLASDGSMAMVVFKQGESSAPWPDHFTITHGGHYTFTRQRANVPVTIHVLDPSGSDPVEYASQLARENCLAQFNILAEAAVG